MTAITTILLIIRTSVPGIMSGRSGSFLGPATTDLPPPTPPPHPPHSWNAFFLIMIWGFPKCQIAATQVAKMLNKLKPGGDDLFPPTHGPHPPLSHNVRFFGQNIGVIENQEIMLLQKERFLDRTFFCWIPSLERSNLLKLAQNPSSDKCSS